MTAANYTRSEIADGPERQQTVVANGKQRQLSDIANGPQRQQSDIANGPEKQRSDVTNRPIRQQTDCHWWVLQSSIAVTQGERDWPANVRTVSLTAKATRNRIMMMFLWQPSDTVSTGDCPGAGGDRIMSFPLALLCTRRYQPPETVCPRVSTDEAAGQRWSSVSGTAQLYDGDK